ncbi:muconolactone Delta-isomerase family protein [Streptomyces sp. NPDC020125]|uniref:muconolactone Delta-isomerase n=1 Tax=Streptomyces sp. NPDC020125 TaxID=3154593 RepID=UPI0034036146
MDFLVRVETVLPPDMPEPDRRALLAQERQRGRELCAAGIVQRIWRLPGQLANVAIWSTPGPEELHEALVSLPVWRYARVTITALAEHPLDQQQQ